MSCFEIPPPTFPKNAITNGVAFSCVLIVEVILIGPCFACPTPNYSQVVCLPLQIRFLLSHTYEIWSFHQGGLSRRTLGFQTYGLQQIFLHHYLLPLLFSSSFGHSNFHSFSFVKFKYIRKLLRLSTFWPIVGLWVVAK